MLKDMYDVCSVPFSLFRAERIASYKIVRMSDADLKSKRSRKQYKSVLDTKSIVFCFVKLKVEKIFLADTMQLEFSVLTRDRPNLFFLQSHSAFNK